MSVLDVSEVDRFEAVGSQLLTAFGISLEIGRDFVKYERLVAEARPDHRVGDPVDYKSHDMSFGKAVWVVGRDADGAIMHTQVLRLLPTGRGSLANYFRGHFREFSPSELDIDFERSRYRAGPGAKNIAGKVVYSAETWVGGKPGQYRGTGLSTILGKFAFLVALREFNPDYVIGFMTKPVAYKGFCLRMGFMHAEPMALRWFIKSKPDPLEGVMVYMSNEDMRFMLDLPSTELEQLAA